MFFTTMLKCFEVEADFVTFIDKSLIADCSSCLCFTLPLKDLTAVN